MKKEYLIILFTSVFLCIISIYNYLTYINLGKAGNKYKNTDIFTYNCNVTKEKIKVGDII